ncbi:hypothetical protein CR64_31670 [Pseudomonas aeruginosa]|nr:hypothetical protein CR64_31670 [Pseudomonas aeruginosa]
MILQPGLHQRRGFPLADAGAQFAVDGFAAGIGQSLDLAEVIEIVGSGYRRLGTWLSPGWLVVIVTLIDVMVDAGP